MDRTPIVVLVAASVLLGASSAAAHCDTMNGPVVAAARIALQRGDVTPVLKWVKAGDEAELRESFRRTAAHEATDRAFFETAVRLHRASEGEPYTGLKDEAPEPVIAAADGALQTGDLAVLTSLLAGRADSTLGNRFARARALLREADTSVAAGRRYVAAYVEYLRYVERLAGDEPSAGDDARRP